MHAFIDLVDSTRRAAHIRNVVMQLDTKSLDIVDKFFYVFRPVCHSSSSLTRPTNLFDRLVKQNPLCIKRFICITGSWFITQLLLLVIVCPEIFCSLYYGRTAFQIHRLLFDTQILKSHFRACTQRLELFQKNTID